MRHFVLIGTILAAILLPIFAFGEAPQQDRSKFRDGEDFFVPMGGVVNDTPSGDVQEDKGAVARITPKQAFHVNLRLSDGTEVSSHLVSGHYGLDVYCIGGCGGGGGGGAVDQGAAGVDPWLITCSLCALESGGNLDDIRDAITGLYNDAILGPGTSPGYSFSGIQVLGLVSSTPGYPGYTVNDGGLYPFTMDLDGNLRVTGTPGTLTQTAHDQMAVTDTAAALPSHAAKMVCFTVLVSGTQPVYYGGASVTTSNGFEILQGGSKCRPVSNSDALYFIADDSGSTVAWEVYN